MILEQNREWCSSVLDCLTGDRGLTDSSLTGGTVLCPRARHLILCLVLTLPKTTPVGK